MIVERICEVVVGCFDAIVGGYNVPECETPGCSRPAYFKHETTKKMQCTGCVLKFQSMSPIRRAWVVDVGARMAETWPARRRRKKR